MWHRVSFIPFASIAGLILLLVGIIMYGQWVRTTFPCTLTLELQGMASLEVSKLVVREHSQIVPCMSIKVPKHPKERGSKEMQMVLFERGGGVS